MPQDEKLIYSARVRTVGGREQGTSRSSDGRLDINLSVPGGPGTGTNPEQLLAAGWSGCFGGAVAIVARVAKVTLPPDATIDTEVDLSASNGGYVFHARLSVNLPGMDRAVAQRIVDAAHRACPFSKALRGDIDLAVSLA